jgi:hypothetical protein
LWTDTCCIKDDNEEEKHGCIDSMFEFYESSAVCLAYLSDLKAHHETSNMARCRWFRRGWTLQEASCPPEPASRHPNGTPTAPSRGHGPPGLCAETVGRF